jgi:ABC-type uncharacterized transport system substrate-binding protein
MLKSAVLGAGAIMLLASGPATASKCLFVSSYHKGYAWSDGVERGLRSVLEGKCELRQFDMDTKRNKSPEDKVQSALEAKEIIESWKPDIVITADDNAAKYLIQAHYKDSDVPFVFNGVNWTVDEYGFPYSNVTGMVEVAPIRDMLETAARIVAPGRRAFYVGANTLTEEKNLRRVEDAASELGIHLDSRLASTSSEWIDAFKTAQSYDFIVLGSNSGINDWDKTRIVDSVTRYSRRLTVTSHGWMMPYAMFGMTKVPEEHGEWSGQVALAILDGAKPEEIPIISNRKWDLWSNESLLQAAGVQLPNALKHKAKRIRN